jgi:hypothetical protein
MADISDVNGAEIKDLWQNLEDLSCKDSAFLMWNSFADIASPNTYKSPILRAKCTALGSFLDIDRVNMIDLIEIFSPRIPLLLALSLRVKEQ